uniref:Uncharacterized protein n=1 Tax=Anopheles epiroticus TaxID=199890 RepID=A0A182PWM4_9DIPT
SDATAPRDKTESDTELDDADDVSSHPTFSDEFSFKDSLCVWSLEANLSHRATNLLLKLIRKNNHLELPQDARTFLQTPSSACTQRMVATVSNGKMWYQGSANSIKSYYKNLSPNVMTLRLYFFVDGLPLHKSVMAQFWPILMRIFDEPEASIMTVALFYGEAKSSSVQDYPEPFVSVMNALQQFGISINGRAFQIRLRTIIADSPA